MTQKEKEKSATKLLASVRIGPAAWSYPDWNVYVYPRRKKKGFHESTFLAEFFDAIGINRSFYSPVKAEHAKQWVERVAESPKFIFTAKLWQRFTHERSGSKEEEALVRVGFEPMRDAGKLGGGLLQFPFSLYR